MIEKKFRPELFDGVATEPDMKLIFAHYENSERQMLLDQHWHATVWVPSSSGNESSGELNSTGMYSGV